MPNKACSVCSAPAPVRDEIDRALRQREKLRDLQVRTGFSRSALSRHGRRHLGREAHLYRRFDVATDRLIIRWPEMDFGEIQERAHLEIFCGRQITEGELRANDFVLAVEFEKFLPRNPAAVAAWRGNKASDALPAIADTKTATEVQESQTDGTGEES
jgi:hypothetical protein